MEDSKDFNELYNSGIRSIQSRDYEKAIEFFHKALEINVKNSDCIYNIGLSHALQKMHDKAIIYFEKAIEINSSSHEYYESLGEAYYYKGVYKKAVEFYLKAIDLNPFMENYYYNTSLAFFYDKLYDDSLKFINISIELDESFPHSYLQRANIYYEKGDYDQSINDCLHAINLTDDKRQFYFRLALIYCKIHDWENAKRYFTFSNFSANERSNFTTESKCIFDKNFTDNEFCIYPSIHDMKDFDRYMETGYMRYGNYLRLKTCRNCSDCKPIRLIVSEFSQSKNNKRILKKNKDIKVQIFNEPFINEEKLELFAKYHKMRHNKNPDADNEFDCALRHFGFINTHELNFYINDKLVGVSIVDLGKETIYSNFFYYDTDYMDRNLGTLSILYEIDYAKLLGKKYYLLGWYVEKASNMSYKKHFKPSEIFEKNEWIKI